MTWLAAHWDSVTPLSFLLSPLSQIFRAAVGLRRAAYRAGLATAHQVPAPVIVVGNLTIGGTGKTPVVLWLAHHLRARGYRPGIVSRGYGGTDAAPRRVTPDSIPLRAGTNPCCSRAAAAVRCGRAVRRAAAARALLAAQPACDVLISDDGTAALRARPGSRDLRAGRLPRTRQRLDAAGRTAAGAAVPPRPRWTPS